MAFEVKIPAVGESITEVTIANWTKKDGDFVEVDEVICEIDSDKATFEINAEKAGIIQIKAKEGETVNVGDAIASIDTTAKGSGKQENKKENEENETTSEANVEKSTNEQPSDEKEKSYASGYPSPAAEKVLKENDIDPSGIDGTGKDGRITKEDALKAVEEKNATTSSAEKTPEAPAKSKYEAPAKAGSRNVHSEKMSTLRKTVARRLVNTKNKTAMLTTFNEVDMSAVMQIRKKYKDRFKEKNEVNLGFMSFFTKAACRALLDFPGVNARIDEDEIVFHDYCDVGIAVSTKRGLVVPVIRNAESLSMAQIEKEIIRLAQKGHDGKVTMEDMQGGTFTITNGGVFGSMLSTPILNDPQSAILGMHNIVERPVAVNGEVVIRPVMYLALSYDHRIVDGKESVSFLYRIKELLEDPARLLLEI